MAKTKRVKKYLNNDDLLTEIAASKTIQTKHPRNTPAECLTPKLVNMLIMLVEKCGQHPWYRGYSYIADMKGDAIASLCQSSLKFDPTKSQNPFGYYTQIIFRCFMTYKDKERQLRTIRDELIEMRGTNLKPSYARQNEGFMERAPPEDKTEGV